MALYRFGPPYPSQVDYYELSANGHELDWPNYSALPVTSKIPEMLYTDIATAPGGFVVVQASGLESYSSARLMLFEDAAPPTAATLKSTINFHQASAIYLADWIHPSTNALFWWFGYDADSGKELGTLEIIAESQLASQEDLSTEAGISPLIEGESETLYGPRVPTFYLGYDPNVQE